MIKMQEGPGFVNFTGFSMHNLRQILSSRVGLCRIPSKIFLFWYIEIIILRKVIGMLAANSVICTVVGPGRKSDAVLAMAVERLAEKLPEEGCPPPEITLRKDIFPQIAEERGRNPLSLERSAARAAHRFYDMLEKDPALMKTIVGERPPIAPMPYEIMMYLAYYVRFGCSYYEVMRKNAGLGRP